MRILWFTNTPSLATEKLTGSFVVGGGWMESMERKVRELPDVELAVAFPWATQEVESLDLDGNSYFKFPSWPQGKWSKLKSRVTNTIEPGDEVQFYLEIVEKFKPDVIHIFGSERSYGLVIPKIKVPTLIWIQGNLTVYAAKWYSGITRGEINKYTKLKTFLNGMSWNHQYVRTVKAAKREQEIFAGCKYFTGRTQWDKRLASVLSPGSTYFHCEELMREAFYERQWDNPASENHLKLFTTIRSNIYKGLENIWETSMHLTRIGKGSISWKLAGISEQDELAQLMVRKYKKTAKEIGLELLGKVDANRLVKELCETNVFVHPSHIDNSPNSVCEAMLMGVPIVSTYAGGIPSLLQDGKEGLLVQDGDSHAMTGAIMEVWNSPELARFFSENARKLGLERNDSQAIIARLFEIYEEVLRQEKGITFQQA
ncbi:MAG: glycosyltransferase [Bacteroidota bacterium]